MQRLLFAGLPGGLLVDHLVVRVGLLLRLRFRLARHRGGRGGRRAAQGRRDRPAAVIARGRGPRCRGYRRRPRRPAPGVLSAGIALPADFAAHLPAPVRRRRPQHLASRATAAAARRLRPTGRGSRPTPGVPRPRPARPALVWSAALIPSGSRAARTPSLSWTALTALPSWAAGGPLLERDPRAAWPSCAALAAALPWSWHDAMRSRPALAAGPRHSRPSVEGSPAP